MASIPAGMTFGQWHDTIPGLATGSPYDPSSFGNTLNNIGSQATQNFNAYLGASPGMQAAGIQPLTHTAMDPSAVNQVANGWFGSANAGSGQPGMTAPATGGYGTSSNPYEGRQADAIRAQQQQFLDQAMNNIRSGAVAVGGLGGSRQGVAQGVAAGQAATGLDAALANLYGSNWNQDQNRALTQYGMDQNFYNAQRGLDQSGAQLGANLYNLGQQGQWMPYQQYTNTLSPWSGFGTTTASGSQGGGVQGAVGGALSGAALGHMAGWW
jgi:hypothetical protein